MTFTQMPSGQSLLLSVCLSLTLEFVKTSRRGHAFGVISHVRLSVNECLGSSLGEEVWCRGWRMGQSEWLMGGFEPNHPGSDLSSVRLWASWSDSSCVSWR